MKTELVSAWMTPDPICVSPDMTLPEAHQLMTQKNIRRLPVVHNGQLVGIVTRGDLRGAQPSEVTSLSFFEITYLLGRITVERIMTKNPITVSPDSTVRDAAKLMLDRKIAGLPVVVEGKVVGILTESDIFRIVVSRWFEDQRGAENIPVAVS